MCLHPSIASGLPALGPPHRAPAARPGGNGGSFQLVSLIRRQGSLQKNHGTTRDGNNGVHTRGRGFQSSFAPEPSAVGPGRGRAGPALGPPKGPAPPSQLWGEKRKSKPRPSPGLMGSLPFSLRDQHQHLGGVAGSAPVQPGDENHPALIPIPNPTNRTQQNHSNCPKSLFTASSLLHPAPPGSVPSTAPAPCPQHQQPPQRWLDGAHPAPLLSPT